MSNKFVRLTLECDCENCNEKPIYVNFDRVETMFVDEDGDTALHMVKTGLEEEPAILFVKEHPDEIMRILQENNI